MPDEATEVRTGDELDLDRLARFVHEALPQLDGEVEVLQFPGGSANLTYLLQVGDTELVLRRPPFGTIAPGAHDMRREYKVLSHLWRHFDRAPRAYVFCDDHEVLGADFFVMERRRGEVVRDELPDTLAHHPQLGRRLGFAVVDAFADLALLDPADCGLADLGRPDGLRRAPGAGWADRWQRVKEDNPLPLMDDVAGRLASSLPTSTITSLVHNDPKLDNCQFDPADPDRVTAVFDWDMTTVGDPHGRPGHAAQLLARPERPARRLAGQPRPACASWACRPGPRSSRATPSAPASTAAGPVGTRRSPSGRRPWSWPSSTTAGCRGTRPTPATRRSPRRYPSWPRRPTSCSTPSWAGTDRAGSDPMGPVTYVHDVRGWPLAALSAARPSPPCGARRRLGRRGRLGAGDLPRDQRSARLAAGAAVGVPAGRGTAGPPGVAVVAAALRRFRLAGALVALILLKLVVERRSSNSWWSGSAPARASATSTSPAGTSATCRSRSLLRVRPRHHHLGRRHAPVALPLRLVAVAPGGRRGRQLRRPHLPRCAQPP